jgi:hypothetical protein
MQKQMPANRDQPAKLGIPRLTPPPRRRSDGASRVRRRAVIVEQAKGGDDFSERALHAGNRVAPQCRLRLHGIAVGSPVREQRSLSLARNIRVFDDFHRVKIKPACKEERAGVKGVECHRKLHIELKNAIKAQAAPASSGDG